MNPIIQSLFERKSVRSFEDRMISKENQELILDSAIQAPTAGNMLLYTILHIEDQAVKERLAILCDNQPFIAKAPFVLVFLADWNKWLDGFNYAGIKARKPKTGDLLLACEDAVIAAQNAVVAAQSLGIGSCYIGDILENKEEISALLNLEEYVFPITMLVFGYPSQQQRDRKKPKRYDKKYIVQKNKYSRIKEDDIINMITEIQKDKEFDYDEYMKAFCERKYMSEFAMEMNRSAFEYIKKFI